MPVFGRVACREEKAKDLGWSKQHRIIGGRPKQQRLCGCRLRLGGVQWLQRANGGVTKVRVSGWCWRHSEEEILWNWGRKIEKLWCIINVKCINAPSILTIK